MISKRFGWLRDRTAYQANAIRIDAIGDVEGAHSELSGRISTDGWLYPQIAGGNSAGAYDRFELPPTHVLTYGGAGNDHLSDFVILFLGCLHGLRLTPEGWGHFYRAATKLGQLVDFTYFERDVARLLRLAERFWLDHQKDGAAAIFFGALHWYVFSQSYVHMFERFLAQYMVLDTLHKAHSQITRRHARRHAERPAFMANELGVPIPSWAVVRGSNCELATIRNALVHDAQFAGAPVGFTAGSRENDILLGLQGFNCRAIAAILGARGAYTRSSCETMQIQGLDVD
jgi:hypothetical protein